MASTETRTFVVLYTYAAGVGEKRAELLDAHRAYLGALTEEGSLLAAGAFLDSNGGLLLLRAPSLLVLEDLLDRDPFHLGAVIVDREIHPWAARLGTALPSLGASVASSV
ncbi:YciI family protein [Microbacterium sp. NPDC077663]|uniref:YciI family protein n=1 Tax=Microbacterium sp. NPDC077663 TaxID=3364189 RepID=UPI0037C508E3